MNYGDLVLKQCAQAEAIWAEMNSWDAEAALREGDMSQYFARKIGYVSGIPFIKSEWQHAKRRLSDVRRYSLERNAYYRSIGESMDDSVFLSSAGALCESILLGAKSDANAALEFKEPRFYDPKKGHTFSEDIPVAAVICNREELLQRFSNAVRVNAYWNIPRLLWDERQAEVLCHIAQCWCAFATADLTRLKVFVREARPAIKNLGKSRFGPRTHTPFEDVKDYHLAASAFFEQFVAERSNADHIKSLAEEMLYHRLMCLGFDSGNTLLTKCISVLATRLCSESDEWRGFGESFPLMHGYLDRLARGYMAYHGKL